MTEIGVGRDASSAISVHYLIVRRGVGGVEPFRLAKREDVAPVFSSRGSAERFLASRVIGEGWRVRGFSDGEVISLLFAFGESIKWMAPNPTEDDVSDAMSRGEFIETV